MSFQNYFRLWMVSPFLTEMLLILHRPGDLRSSFCELAHQDVFRKSHDVAPLGDIMGCNPRHDGPPNGGPSQYL